VRAERLGSLWLFPALHQDRPTAHVRKRSLKRGLARYGALWSGRRINRKQPHAKTTLSPYSSSARWRRPAIRRRRLRSWRANTASTRTCRSVGDGSTGWGCSAPPIRRTCRCRWLPARPTCRRDGPKAP
jgi:hypothetical protein